MNLNVNGHNISFPLGSLCWQLEMYNFSFLLLAKDSFGGDLSSDPPTIYDLSIPISVTILRNSGHYQR